MTNHKEIDKHLEVLDEIIEQYTDQFSLKEVKAVNAAINFIEEAGEEKCKHDGGRRLITGIPYDRFECEYCGEELKEKECKHGCVERNYDGKFYCYRCGKCFGEVKDRKIEKINLNEIRGKWVEGKAGETITSGDDTIKSIQIVAQKLNDVIRKLNQ